MCIGEDILDYTPLDIVDGWPEGKLLKFTTIFPLKFGD